MKKFLIAFALLMALITGYFIYEYHAGIRHLLFEKFGWFPTAEQLELMKGNKMMERWQQEQKYFLRFAGQNTHLWGTPKDTNNNAWLVKGKLLDQQYADVFAKITDTIAMDFGESFCFVPQTESPYKPDARFVFASKTTVDSLIIKDTDDENELHEIYAKLVYEGKAAGYRIVPEKFYSPKYLLQRDYFQDKYGSYFHSSASLEDVDHGIKEILLDELFNTEEGKNFGYSQNNGDYREYVVERDFTHSGRDEFAIVLTDLEEEKLGRNKHVVIVVAYNPKQDNYYLLYKKMFYDKVKIGEYFYFNDEDRYRQYQGEDEQHEKVEYCIHVRVPDEPERVLRYNKAFDNMEEISEDEFQKADF